jgi:hypothetical protein
MMSGFPRIKENKFDIDRYYTVPSHLTGRLDLIALDVYNNVKMYKVLAAANNIRIPMGCRYGIRQTRDALETELSNDGVSDANLNSAVDVVLDEKRYNDYDWDGYNNITLGYISEVYAGRLLLVPTYETAVNWLRKYEYISNEE